jgi:peptidoglycan-associated lipoprotein
MRARLLPVLIACGVLSACGANKVQTRIDGNGGSPPPVAEPLPPEVPLAEAFRRDVADTITFAYDSSELSPEARAILDRQAAWISEHPDVSLRIEGHADERGTREYNLALGDRRANAARNYLVVRGVNAARLSTISYGEERPVAIGNDEAAWSQNRRAMTAMVSR